MRWAPPEPFARRAKHPPSQCFCICALTVLRVRVSSVEMHGGSHVGAAVWRADAAVQMDAARVQRVLIQMAQRQFVLEQHEHGLVAHEVEGGGGRRVAHGRDRVGRVQLQTAQVAVRAAVLKQAGKK